MPVRARRTYLLPFLFLILSAALPIRAAIVRGTVTTSLGKAIVHANVILLQKGQIVAIAVTRSDGTYQISSSVSGRFYVLVSASNFKQITTQSFYAGTADSHQEDIVLESSNARQEMVSSATGLPTAEAQVSSAVTRAAQRNLSQSHRPDRSAAPGAGRFCRASGRVRRPGFVVHSWRQSRFQSGEPGRSSHWRYRGRLRLQQPVRPPESETSRSIAGPTACSTVRMLPPDP